MTSTLLANSFWYVPCLRSDLPQLYTLTSVSPDLSKLVFGTVCKILIGEVHWARNQGRKKKIEPAYWQRSNDQAREMQKREHSNHVRAGEVELQLPYPIGSGVAKMK